MTPELYQRVKQLFMQSLEIPQSERAAWLNRECGSDLELRKEVESLLSTQPEDALLTGSQVVGSGSSRPSGSNVTAPSSTTLVPPSLWVRMGGKRRRWVLIALVATIWIVVSYSQNWLHYRVSDSLREIRGHELQATLGMQATAVQELFKTEIEKHESWVRPIVFRGSLQKLASGTMSEVQAKDLKQKMPLYFKEFTGNDHQFVFCSTNYEMVLDHSVNSSFGTTVKALIEARERIPELRDGFANVVTGQRYLLVPNQKITKIDPEAANYLTLFLPVISTDDNKTIVGFMAFRSREPIDRLRDLLARGRVEKSLESIAFNSEGTLLTESRFIDQLPMIGRLSPQSNHTAIMRLTSTDPGGDMTADYKPGTPPEEWPLTWMAQRATAGISGMNLDGYRDYRGVKVIGAWTWLDQYNIGLATEIDYAEAYSPLVWLQNYFTFRLAYSFTALFILLLVLLNLNGHWARTLEMSETARRPETDQFGPYTVVKQIGIGGMGVVYLARHALLKRPTALKLLKPEQVSRHTLVLFEREVQLISSLNHPNIVQVYDYGMTPTGVFYYAMEYVDGLTLEQLVRREGSVTPARLIYLLKQVCSALQVAHSKALIHRDIKPQNIMICRSGDEADVIKLLDFGLVKELDPDNSHTLTGALSGTPLYMAPERFRSPQTVDLRADIYAVGAVAFRLLTGHNVPGVTTSSSPTASGPLETVPSHLATQPIPHELDVLVASCLAFEPAERPASATELLERLDSIPCAESWTEADAQRWWQAYEGSAAGDSTQHKASQTTQPPPASIIGHE